MAKGKLSLFFKIAIFSNLLLCAEPLTDLKTQNRTHWEKFYTETPEDLQKPSPFAEATLPNISRDNILLEFGCGNGRDALFFAKNGIKVYACDLCKNAITQLNRSINSDNPTFFVADFSNLGSTLTNLKIDTIYSRFTLHSISKEDSLRVFKWSFARLQPNGLFLIEARSIHDPLFGKGTQVEKNAYVTDHYRRFLVLDELIEDLKKSGFKIQYAKESQGFAKYQDEDPPIIRVIAQK